MTDTTRHNMEVASLCERVDKVLERVLTSPEGRTGGGARRWGLRPQLRRTEGSHRRGDQCYFIVTQSFREIEPGPVSLLPLTLHRHSSIFRRPDYKWDIPANRAGVFLSGGARIRL